MKWNKTDIRIQATTARSARRGFTLVEALIAATILAIVAASVSLPFVAVAQQLNASVEIETAVQLGEELMEEVLARPFYAPGETARLPGPEAAEKERRQFNAIDDFHNYNEFKGAGVTAHLEDYAGAAITGDDTAGFYRRVFVEYVRLPDQAADDSNFSFVRIVVRVIRDGRNVFQLTRVKTREY